MTRALLVQMAGHGGSGKSTLARQIALQFDGVSIDLDVVKTALLDAGLDWALASSASYETIFAMVDDLLSSGTKCIIVDTPSYWSEIHQRLTASALKHQARYIFVECRAEEAVRAQRIVNRSAKRSQIQVLGTAPRDDPQQAAPTHLRPIAQPTSGPFLIVETGDSVDLEALFAEITTLTNGG
jgi:predicted kinase